MVQIFNQPPLYLFSTEHMPCAPRLQPHAQMRWVGADTEKRYKVAPHPLLRPEDVTYNFNSLGYRCPEFNLDKLEKKVISVVSIGASEVFGIGLPEDKTFPHQFAKLLEKETGYPVINWNLGMGGASSDYMSRTLFSALAVLKPDVVLFVLPPPRRREHINQAGRAHFYINTKTGINTLDKLKTYLVDPGHISQIKANNALSSDFNDQINYFKNYLICQSICERHDVMWLFSFISNKYMSHIDPLVKKEHLVAPGLLELGLKHKDNPAEGLARDMGHPGIKPNQEMAELFLERLKALYSTRLESI